MLITLSQLKAKKACSEQVYKFKKLFGASVEVTEDLCRKHAEDFNWDWVADNLLSAPALKAYDEATAPAWKAYDEATAPAWKACDEATALAWKAYNEATALARKAYNEDIASAYKTFREAQASAFFHASQLED